MGFMRSAVLIGIFLDIVLVAVFSTGMSSPLRMPGGGAYVTKAMVLLAAYSLLVIFGFNKASISRQAALRMGGYFGAFGGLVLILHMVLENCGKRIGENPIVTLAFMLGAFLVWGAAGYCVTRSTGEIGAGLVVSCWSAMVSALMAVTFGLVLLAVNIPPSEYVATWSEFRQSGWTDARAFAIANSLDAVFSHLIVAPIVAIVFGIFGAGFARMRPCRATTGTLIENLDAGQTSDNDDAA